MNAIATSNSPALSPVLLSRETGCALADSALLAFRREFVDNPAYPEIGIWAFMNAHGFSWGPDQPETCFNLAAVAVSLAVSAAKDRITVDLSHSRAVYAHALLKTRDVLSQDPLDPTDELLMTCILLSAYEVGQSCGFITFKQS
jgi:hypothetical protein